MISGIGSPSLYFTGSKKTPPKKTVKPAKTLNRVDFRVTDLGTAINGMVGRYMRNQLDHQKHYETYGWHTLDPKTGQGAEVITDAYLAIWNGVVKPILEDEPNRHFYNEQDLFNLGVFLLLNESTEHETGRPSWEKNFFFKQEKNGVVTLKDLHDKSITRVLTQFLRPEVTMVGGEPLTLKGLVTKPPTLRQLQSLQKTMEKRHDDMVKRATQQKEEQKTIKAEFQREQEAAAARLRQQRLDQQQAEERQYRVAYGFDGLATATNERKAVAQKFKYPSQQTKITQYTQKADKNDALVREHRDSLSRDEVGRLTREAAQLRQTAQRLSNPPILEFKIQDSSFSELRDKLSVLRDKQVRTGDLKFADSGDFYPLRSHDNTGYYDDRIALWQAVITLLRQAQRTPAEEGAMDMGLLLLNNPPIYEFDNHRGNRLQEPEYLADLLSGDPERISRNTNLKLTYPTEAQWQNITHQMTQLLNQYHSDKTRQNKQIDHLRWLESPEGRYQTAENRRQNAIQDEIYNRRWEADQAAAADARQREEDAKRTDRHLDQ